MTFTERQDVRLSDGTLEIRFWNDEHAIVKLETGITMHFLPAGLIRCMARNGSGLRLISGMTAPGSTSNGTCVRRRAATFALQPMSVFRRPIRK